jgi:hypothetical protein
MAELSEVTCAAFLYYPEDELRKIAGLKELTEDSVSSSQSLEGIVQNTKGKFYKAIKNEIEFGDKKDKTEAENEILKVLKNKNKEGYDAVFQNVVKGLSGALTIYKWLSSGRHSATRISDIKQVYITGGKWPKDIEEFNIKVPGMQAYNSSDLVIKKQLGKDLYFYGVSLKKRGVSEGSPTLINNTTANALEELDAASTKKKDISLLDYVDNVRQDFILDILLSDDFREVLHKGAKGISDIKLGFGDKREAINSADKGNYPDKKGSQINLNMIKAAQREWLAVYNNDNTTITQFQKQVITKKPKTKPTYGSIKPWINLDGFRNPEAAKAGIPSFGKTGTVRAYVNSQYYNKQNIFWKTLKNKFTRRSPENAIMARALASRVLKFDLPALLTQHLNPKSNNPFNFGFALVTGVGDYNMKKNTFRIRAGEAHDVHTVICTLAELMHPKTEYRIEWDKALNNASQGEAKIWLKLVAEYKRKEIYLLQIEIRYKGSFTSWPQFQAYLSPELKSLLGNGHCIT